MVCFDVEVRGCRGYDVVGYGEDGVFVCMCVYGPSNAFVSFGYEDETNLGDSVIFSRPYLFALLIIGLWVRMCSWTS